jgi:hypothetical protein
VESNAVTNMRNHTVLNKNISQIATEPARRVAGGGQSAAANNQQPASAPMVKNFGGGGTLSPTPRTLYDLWVEYITGIGGRKPACDFTAQEQGRDKYRFYRRKHVWDIVVNLVNAGVQARVAIDRIYNHYGANMSVSNIIKDIMRDKRNGGLPQALMVGMVV